MSQLACDIAALSFVLGLGLLSAALVQWWAA
jgi:hypothetical protein